MHDEDYYSRPKMVRLPIAIYLTLKRFAEEHQRSVAAELRVAVSEYLDRAMDASYPGWRDKR